MAGKKVVPFKAEISLDEKRNAAQVGLKLTGSDQEQLDYVRRSSLSIVPVRATTIAYMAFRLGLAQLATEARYRERAQARRRSA